VQIRYTIRLRQRQWHMHPMSFPSDSILHR
jgi:hypothetical protein